MELTSITIGIPVGNLEMASQWYERCLELKAHIEPATDIREYQIFPGCWLQLSEAETTTSQHSLLLGVVDLDAERQRLKGLGVEVGEINRVEGLIAWFDFQDPDGNNLSLYRVEQSSK
jgi:predicted enzyme related to lactoylglutathione lyase